STTAPPTSSTVAPVPTPSGGACDASYPDVCIPPGPPDLDCPEITHRNFRVVGPDPHRFDGNHDGVGCET
ncbi:MAG: thermonuclease family protein, partial [Acidimicrobiia bacterium]